MRIKKDRQQNKASNKSHQMEKGPTFENMVLQDRNT